MTRILLMPVIVLALILTGCGEDTPCKELKSIQKKLCKGAEECFPCVCFLCGVGRDIPLRLGLPDIMNSSCAEPESCEGYALSQAEACLPHAPSDTDEVPGTEWIENDCDPRYAYGVWICGNDGSYNPALPEAWAKGTAMMDCGW